ncbi:E3 ubiquitin-protein ligase TRIM7-like [Rhineura floridana]|uniref:E3 ubiquitin-protein ligase TRIM7-like n=1 Tax=Rhineura floridana TaxID=261503 RepID=UPI002AC85401|nr:E3 ubiquitin-protein ligase TRIM7-like [Rhineura floridana]
MSAETGAAQENMGELEEEELPCLQGEAESLRERHSTQTLQMRKATRLSLLLQAVKRSRREAVCEKHQEPLKVFCMEDRTFLCVICGKSKTHGAHAVLPIEEAAEDYKNKIQIYLQNQKMERNIAEGWKLTQKKLIVECLENIKVEREKILREFQQLLLFLKEQESCLLAQLGELEKEIEKMEEENSNKLSSILSAFGCVISDLERVCQRPADEFLQDLKETISRCEKRKFCWPVERSTDVEQIIRPISWKSIVLTENFKKLKETLAAELKRGRTTWQNPSLEEQANQPQVFWPAMSGDSLGTGRKVYVNLDLRTANPKLIVSQDRKTVRHGDQLQALPDYPERFDSEPFVLGHVGFCSGRHCWVVNVEQGQNWAIGIARESVKRKGYISLSPEQGIWAMEQCWGQFQALTSRWTSLSLIRKPRRIQVCLDYEGGWLSFFDADLDAPLFTFPPISFNQERIYPWLWVGPGSYLILCP